MRIIVLGGMVAAVLLVAVLGFFLMRPAVVLGVDGGSLQCSVDCAAKTDVRSCRHLDGDEWSCSYTVPYLRALSYDGSVTTRRVKVDGYGCWHSTDSASRRISGCVGILDY